MVSLSGGGSWRPLLLDLKVGWCICDGIIYVWLFCHVRVEVVSNRENTSFRVLEHHKLRNVTWSGSVEKQGREKAAAAFCLVFFFLFLWAGGWGAKDSLFYLKKTNKQKNHRRVSRWRGLPTIWSNEQPVWSMFACCTWSWGKTGIETVLRAIWLYGRVSKVLKCHYVIKVGDFR